MAIQERTVSTNTMSDDSGESGALRYESRQSNEMNLVRMLNAVDQRQIARGLGWFSIGLGLAEIAAPDTVARIIGLRNSRLVLQAFGLREIISGIGILAGRRPSEWLWSRVGGDVMDLAFLGSAFSFEKADRARLAAATFAVAGVTGLDVVCSRQLSRRQGTDTETSTILLVKSIAINRTCEDLYRFWRDFHNLPQFMFHLDSVQVLSDKRSHWVAKAPAGGHVEWDAEIVEDRPSEMIAWRTVAGSDVQHSGTVSFKTVPGGRGAIVRVEIDYCPPGGTLGTAVAKLFGREPGQQVQEDLRRFKQLMEAGEIVTTEGQPSGRASSTSCKYDQTSRRDAELNAATLPPLSFHARGG